MYSPLKVSRLLLLVSISMCGLAGGEELASATVSFTLDFPGANPSHYEITVGGDGRGSYRSNGQFDQQSEPADPEPLQFSFSARVRSQIFALVQRAHYFAGKIDS